MILSTNASSVFMCFLFVYYLSFESWRISYEKEVNAPPSSLQEGLSAAWVPRDPLPECGECSGKDPRDMNHTKGGLVIFTANSHPSSRELGKRIAEWVHVFQLTYLTQTNKWKQGCGQNWLLWSKQPILVLQETVCCLLCFKEEQNKKIMKRQSGFCDC